MADRVILVCTLLLAGVYFHATQQLPSLEIGDPLGPKAFPHLITLGLIVTAFLLLLEILRARRERTVAAAVAEATDYRPYLVVAGAAGWTVLYFLVFERLGYVIATAVYLFVLMAYFNRGRWLANALTAVLFCLASYYMFQLLGVSLARGVLPF
jgi:putative tricarboxylic transport membrane protein